MKSIISRVLMLLLSIQSILTFAQSGHNDPTFNTLDSGYAHGANNTIVSVIALDNGQSVIAGYFTHYYGLVRGRIAKINSDESLDVAFASGAGANETINVVVAQSDGKLIIGGNFTQYDGVSVNRIARLYPDGSLDPSFNSFEGFDGQVFAICLQADGKIIVGGNFNNFNGSPASKLIKLNADGSADDSFTIGSGLDNVVRSIALQSDGKILVGGNFTQFNTNEVERIVRLTPNGNIDLSFVVSQVIDNQVQKIIVQPDQKILLGGLFYLTTPNYAGLVRLLPTGAIDNSFMLEENAPGSVSDIDVLPDGKIIISGGSYPEVIGTDYKNGIFRLNSNGSLDTSFESDDSYSLVGATAVHSNGRLVCVGNFELFNNQTRTNLVSLTANGIIDPGVSNDFGAGFDASVCAVKVQPDDKIIACGGFRHFNGVSADRIIRLMPDGTADNTFTPGTGFNGRALYCLIQPDGKILVYGEFTSFNGITRNGLARINSNGSLDLGFNPGAELTGYPTFYAMALQPDGKILISSNFGTINGVLPGNFFRLNVDGTLDSSFNYQSPPGNTVYIDKMLPLSDGNILVYRRMFSGGNDNYKICRHNNTGALDNTFTPIAVSQSYTDGQIAVDTAGKIYFIDAYFIGGNSQNVLKRYLSTGVIDPNFPAINVGTFYPLLRLLPDEKILVGCYTEENYNLFRINTDGTIDSTFANDSAFDGYLENFDLQSDGKIIASGHFTEFDNVGRNRLARVFNEESLGVNVVNSENNQIQMSCSNKILTVNGGKNKVVSVDVYDISTKLIGSLKNINQTNVLLPLRNPPTWVIVRVTAENNTSIVRKIVVQ
jgi:uncharacterized delta-60 repeat protein